MALCMRICARSPVPAPSVSAPSLVSLDKHDAGLFRNYAIPDDGAEVTPTQVAELVAVFVARGRTPRLEYLPRLCPAVEPGLVAAGFVPERRLPVMTCAPACWPHPFLRDRAGLDQQRRPAAPGRKS